MSIKYKVQIVPNSDYSEAFIRKKLKAIQHLKEAKTLLKMSTDNEMDADVKSVVKTLHDRMHVIRGKLKQQMQVPKNKKVINVTSDRTWKIFNIEVDYESGLTKYNGYQDYRIDNKIEFENKDSIKGLIDDAKEQSLKILRDYRKRLKNISCEEKQFNVADLPFTPTYKVYQAGGMRNSSFETVYKDALRGTEYKYTIPEVYNTHVIHFEKGTFLELQQAKNLRKVFERKSPTTNDKHVGIEIEFVSKLDKYELAKQLQKEQLQDYVCLVDDGSIRTVEGFPHAHEITILATETDIHSILERVLAVLNKDGMSRVGKRCGLHVHLDMRNRDRSLVYHNLFKAQRILYAMNPRSRLDGIDETGRKDTVYSKKVEWEDFETAWSALNDGNSGQRYNGINLLALQKHNTIEIRIHSGSTNFTKISNWVKILTSIANMGNKVLTEAFKPETFCRNYNLDNEVLAYIKQRIEKFKDASGKHITIEEVA